jgi:nicotinate-nucleotide pyrophosphorylase (carboxylating)
MDSAYDELIKQALVEDLPDGVDATADPLFAEHETGRGVIIAKADGIIAGTKPAEQVFHSLDARIRIEIVKRDGERVADGDEVMRIDGNLRAILRGERTALNFLCHLSGIATLTAKFIEVVRDYRVEILCTRKTAPGLRRLDVEAVKSGGGGCYRTNLSQAILIKDNHLAALGGLPGLGQRLNELERESPTTRREIIEQGKLEVTSVEELAEGIGLGFKNFLLDNFTVAEVARAVKSVPSGIFLEVSGGVTLANVKEYARTGVPAISVGALTHSTPALNMSLEIQERASS